MKIVFITNYYNHHQAPLAKAFHDILGDQYVFIETRPMREERIRMGWREHTKPAYVKQAYGNYDIQYFKKLIIEADVVIWGGCPFSLVCDRLKQAKLTFCYSERLFKHKEAFYKTLARKIKYFLRLAFFQKNHYLLCSSAFSARDYNSIGLFRGRAFKWGYFPELTVDADVEKTVACKKKNEILWCGRFLEWKHPIVALQLAKQLKENDIDFRMRFVGGGQQEEVMRLFVAKYQLEDFVVFEGYVASDEVRKYMLQAGIYLFTSDFREGWGAVLNEAMNSACAVVACSEIGSVPYLIEDGKNGLVYSHESSNALYCLTERLLKNHDEQKRLGLCAYNTVFSEWNARNAAEKFIKVSEKLIKGLDLDECFYKDGVASIG